MAMTDQLQHSLRRAVDAADAGPPELTAAAAAAGLLDVAYATTDSPLGTILLAATPGGLVQQYEPNQ